MKNIFKKKPIIHYLLLILIVFAINGCNKKADVTPTQNTTGSWGEVIPIPGIAEGVAGDAVRELKTSNEGIYMEISMASSNNDWIYRLNGFSVPTWTKHEEPDNYFDWEPSNENSEGADDFAIYFQTINKNGFVNINNGLPALLEENNPGSGSSEMLYDNSPGNYKWYFSGSDVKIKQNNNSGLYNTICTLPSGGILFAEADPTDAIVWAAGPKTIYKITVNGAITPFDVSSYDDPAMVFHSIEKIRFPYDVLHKDVYFRFQNKVFKITDGNTLSLFYTIKNESNFLGGDFCVDNTFMYATDGTKKHLQLLNETNIIPPTPNTTDQKVLLDYISNVSSFKVGPIEVLKNSTDNSIYNIYRSRKLLRVPKSL
ncbi:MAG: hypothetical protein K9G64_03040 [Bacteroidia bacterium]|nr:hypothetical protein [Bacteroidia bacterium]